MLIVVAIYIIPGLEDRIFNFTIFNLLSTWMLNKQNVCLKIRSSYVYVWCKCEECACDTSTMRILQSSIFFANVSSLVKTCINFFQPHIIFISNIFFFELFSINIDQILCTMLNFSQTFASFWRRGPERGLIQRWVY